ncbi:MAG: hybrid sensor histidine kinase/response regulator, partial [Methylomonas lenta]|nr:hybrid sensor histidine kinase/response regulator [Methylomonas lenta]
MRIPKPLFDNLATKAFFRQSIADDLGRGLFNINLRNLFSIPYFDTEIEYLFWQERYLVLLTPLKFALVLGAIAFLAYILLDLYTGNITP